jgi:hypothetical protein
MKFIEIKPGKNLRKDAIIDVEAVNEMTCKLTTAVGVYDCIYPSWRILMLLEEPSMEEQIAMRPESPTDRTNLFGAQHWAG